MSLSFTIRVMLGILLPVIFLLLILHTTYRPPNVLIKYFQRRWPDILFRVNTQKKIVALTIDDAPSEYTQSILEVLRANEARATFFVIGSQVPEHENVLKDVIQAGNELGNHAMYDEPSHALEEVELQSQIEAVDNILSGLYAESQQETPRYFRPGSGFFNARMRALVQKMSYTLVLGGIYPHDPQISFWRVNACHVLSMVQAGGIIICHDRRSWTVPMLKKILPELRRRDYKVVTVTELLKQADN